MQRGVLYISPRATDANILAVMLRSEAIPVEHAENLKSARRKLAGENYPVIVTEARLPDGNWEDVLSLLERRKPATQVIVTDARADARFWADALDSGAYDVLAQPFCGPEVQRIVHNALHSPVELRKVAPAGA